MSEPRGPTTEELRARVLAHHRREAEKRAAQVTREGQSLEEQVWRNWNAPLDERRAEHLGSAP